jgi:hypothetical protein
MRRALLCAAALALLAVPSPAHARPFYDGHVSRLGFGKTRVGSQGAGWQAVFHERAQGPVRYRMCLAHELNHTSRCWSRTTRADGRSVIFVALFVNDKGGTWSVARDVAGARSACCAVGLRGAQ